jgi:hypothetical protein
MASNFGIAVDRNINGFGLKLGLKTVHPFGLEVFHRNMSPRNGQSAKIVFTGNHASLLSMGNSRMTS